MPCYVEPPDISFDEHKKRMFEDGLLFLTKEQIKELNISIIDDLLCKICKLLSLQQIRKISPNTGYIGLFEWYATHLLDDYKLNYGTEEAEAAQREAERIGMKLSKEKAGFSISNNSFSIIK